MQQCMYDHFPTTNGLICTSIELPNMCVHADVELKMEDWWENFYFVTICVCDDEEIWWMGGRDGSILIIHHTDG